MKINEPEFMPQEEHLLVPVKPENLLVGIPKEQNKFENRVSLTPEGVYLLVERGHSVIVEKGAGISAGYTDLEYSEVGAIISSERDEIFSCELVVKVAEPNADEIKLFKPGQILLSAIHLNSVDHEYINSLRKKGITAFNYSKIINDEGRASFVRSMSEIAGNESITLAMEYLNSLSDGAGYSMAGVTGVPPLEIVILGAGTVGTVAARLAAAIGAKVKVFDSSITRLQRLREHVGADVYTCTIQPRILSNAIKECNVAIGAMRPVNGRAPMIISREMVSSMQEKSIIVDVSIDSGGCFETTELRSLESPSYVKNGVIHYSVPNIASRVSRTASFALNNLTSSFILRIGEEGGIESALNRKEFLRKGIYIYKGTITHREMAEPYGVPFTEIDLLL